MFRSARIKLTAWYVLIIMIVSIAFSAVIYKVLTLEVERFARAQRSRIERRFSPMQYPKPSPDFSDPDLVAETKHRILMSLLFVNGSILVLSGGLAYLLAGRTLGPIKNMIDEQNQFISDASHEFRTPLTSLKSALEVNLRDKHLSLDAAKKIMQENIVEVNNLQSLSDNLLALAQYQTPNNHIVFIPVDIKKTLTVAIKKITPIAKKRLVKITTHIEPITIEANQYSLLDLFVIILDNAVKYSYPHTTIHVRSTVGDGQCTITIADSGIGISAENLPHVFDRFYRADSARSKTQITGYGLGLAIAKQITQAHLGTITATSTIKKGTIITITLPLKHKPSHIKSSLWRYFS